MEFYSNKYAATSNRRQRLVVMGGTGFVGQHLIKTLVKCSDFDVVYAVHRSEPAWLSNYSIDVARLDVEDSHSIELVLGKNCTVLNLLRPDGKGWFGPAISNILQACQKAHVKRYIHISSIDVFGATSEVSISSNSSIHPITMYEREHANAENLVRITKDFEVVVARLGAVFGDGGMNIVSFVNEVSRAPLWKLALRRFLYGERRMHLVSIAKVIDTLIFLARAPTLRQGEIILVTDDDSIDNNFAYLQDSLMRAFNRPPLLTVPHLPFAILKLLLKFRGVSNSNPARRFREHRLAELGQKETIEFSRELHIYIEHLRRTA